MYTVSKGEDGFSIDPMKLTDQPFCVFGIRPCDVRALTVMDQVFLADPVDTFYKARREQAILVSLACHRPAQTCFCSVFGIDAAQPDGADEQFSELLSDTDDTASVEEEKESIRSITKKLPYSSLSLEGWGAGKTDEKFDDPNWQQLSDACLACGTCTFVCPTCQCYDIKDYDTGHGIQRYRCWDSCMYSDFTLMAAANNRTTQMQRYRQRFMHKLVYFPTNNNGMYMCVGCGRCVDRCPQALNIVKVIKTMDKGREEEKA